MTGAAICVRVLDPDAEAPGELVIEWVLDGLAVLFGSLAEYFVRAADMKAFSPIF